MSDNALEVEADQRIPNLFAHTNEQSVALPNNDPVHRAAASDVDFRFRAGRGSVCNGLLAAVSMQHVIHGILLWELA